MEVFGPGHAGLGINPAYEFFEGPKSFSVPARLG